jgi:Arc-like DNA binding domain
MVKTPDTARIADIPPFGLRLPRTLKDRVEASARANSRSLNAEITARLEQSFGEAAGSEDTLARGHDARLKVIEDALRVLGSEDCYVDILNVPAQKLLAGILDKLPPKRS